MGRWLVVAAAVAVLVLLFMIVCNTATPSDASSASEPPAISAQSKPGDDAKTHDGAQVSIGDPTSIRSTTLGGQVRGTDAQPIAGAEVCAWPATVFGPPRCSKTAADGRYQIEAVPRSVIMSASAVGFVPSHRPSGHEHGRVNTHGDDRSGLDFTLSRGGIVMVGVIVDVFGGPVEGAMVTVLLDADTRGANLVDPRSSPLRAISDAEGRFTVPTKRGAWVIKASAAGYADARVVALTPGPTVAIAMMPEATLSGTVVEAGSDRPVPGARITLRSWVNGLSFDRIGGYADDDGHFRITGLTPGRYRPGATKGEMFGTASQSFAVDLAESIDDVRIEMTAGATLSAHVRVSPDDVPCTGGNVRIADAASDEQRVEAIASDGAVEIEGLLPGRYEVSVSCDGHSSAATDRSLELMPGTNEVTWHVDRGITVRGKLLDADGTGRRGYVVMFAAAGNGDGLLHNAEAGDDGGFAVEGMSVGPHSLAASLSDGAQVSKTIDVSPTLGEVELRLPPSASLVGNVTRGSKAVGDARLRARPTGKDAQVFAGLGVTRSSDDGSYVFDDLPPGPYEVSVVDETEAALATAKVELAIGGTTFDFVLPQTADLVGVVLDAAGKPVPDASVTALVSTALSSVDARADALRSATRSTPVVTDADGAFTIVGVDERATFTVLAQRRGGGQALSDGVHPNRPVTLRMSGLGDVVGTVESPTAITGLSVALHRVDGYSALRESFSVGSGNFTFRRVPPGTYDVVAIARQGRARGRVEVSATKTARVSLVLEANRTFRGRFVDPRTATPLPEVYAVVTDEDGEVADLTMKAERLIATRPDGVLSNAEGHFTLRDVPSRTARLFAFGADFGDGLPDILEFLVVPAGAETNTIVDIPLVRRNKAALMGDPFGVTLAVPMFCTDTPRVSKVVGAAAAAGIRVGDEIAAVDGHDVTGTHCYLAAGLMRATPGMRVELTLGRGEVVPLLARAADP